MQEERNNLTRENLVGKIRAFVDYTLSDQRTHGPEPKEYCLNLAPERSPMLFIRVSPMGNVKDPYTGQGEIHNDPRVYVTGGHDKQGFASW